MTENDRRAATAAHWGLADYSGLAQRLEPAADALIDAVAPRPGERVLDVASGTGNVAVRAAARGTWVETDVEELPLPDASMDVALSAFGLIFAPHPEVALAQLRRVLLHP